MTSLRFNVVEKAFQAKPQPVAVPDGRPSEYFGKYVFNREKMFKYLPSTVYAPTGWMPWTTGHQWTGTLPMKWPPE